MTPANLANFLTRLIREQNKLSVMIWGAPGIGKSSIVAQLADSNELELIDLRLSQLAPTDLRGLPVADHDTKTSRWFPPEFLPSKGRGILFLDEINMAPPAMQGIAQQLILDRQVGNYNVPEGWFVWAAGNRKEDRASVFDMPAPLANRFIHLEVSVHLETFRRYAFAKKLNEQILAFLQYRPSLLHKLAPDRPAWPSPRSWEVAGQLHQLDLGIEPAVGEGVAAEFEAYLKVYTELPNIQAILEGQKNINFPKDPSKRYATVTALVARAQTPEAHINAFRWLVDKSSSEWVQLFAMDMFNKLQDEGKMGVLVELLQKETQLKRFLKDFQTLLAET